MKLIMRRLFLCGTALFLISAGSRAEQGDAPIVTGIRGVVTLEPDNPYPNSWISVLELRYRGHCEDCWKVIAEIQSDSQGEFELSLPAGFYKVVGESKSPYPRCSSQMVKVVNGQLTPVNLKCDAGIRG